jgi:small subunit ribosomal protein S16
MVTIRLTRRGAKKLPFYHIVVTDSRMRQGGTILEQVGFFDPVAKGKSVKLNLDLARVEHWQKNGAMLSDRVDALVKTYRKQAVAA